MINLINTMNINQLKQACPLPELMRRVGLGKYAKSSCCSPFRNDSKPSFGIFQRDNQYYFKDFASNEHGDEISLLALHMQVDPQKDFLTVLQRYHEIATSQDSLEQRPLPTPEVQTLTPAAKPNAAGFGTGTNIQPP